MKFPIVLLVLLTSALGNTRAYQTSVTSGGTRDEIVEDISANATSHEETPQAGIRISGATSNPIVLKGASAGPVTLIAPSEGPIVILKGIDSNWTEGRVRTDAAGAVVTLDSAEGAGSISISEGTDSLEGNGGLVSSSAVIGPSTGAVVVAGPTALPVILAAPESLATQSTESIDMIKIIPEASEQSGSSEPTVRVNSSVVTTINMSVGGTRPSTRDDSLLIDEGTEQSAEFSVSAEDSLDLKKSFNQTERPREMLSYEKFANEQQNKGLTYC